MTGIALDTLDRAIDAATEALLARQKPDGHWVFALEADAQKRKAIADEIQVRAVTLGTHFPLGEWYGLFAHRTTTKGWLPPMGAMVFWNAEKVQ